MERKVNYHRMNLVFSIFILVAFCLAFSPALNDRQAMAADYFCKTSTKVCPKSNGATSSSCA